MAKKKMTTPKASKPKAKGQNSLTIARGTRPKTGNNTLKIERA